jgi:class 3 adenylate cyclase/tetratricopeptide (TPR) repeat protein
MACGSPLAVTCSSCGTENPPGAKFCIECGTALTGRAAPAAAAPEPPAPTTAPVAAPTHGMPEQLPEERRMATVLFADLSGYTAVAERMDPEATKALVDRSLRRLGQEVERHGGRVDKYIGDNVMAVFGAPLAHEDDPERAVRAGLAMQAAMEEINEELAANPASRDVSFLLRVGINSGEVLAGRVGESYTVIGDPVNVAARLQAAARPGTVTVGELTHRLTRRAIEYVELEPLELKGKSEPVPAWEAVRVLLPGVAGPLARAETPLIGREDESALLISMYERVVREARPHLVTVIGQAGIGKTRLLREFTDQVAARPDKPAVRVGNSPAYGPAIGYWALGEIIRGQFEIVDSDDPGAAFAKLRHGVEELLEDEPSDEPPERIAALIARPLGIEPPAEVELGLDSEDPQQIRDRIFSAIRTLAEAVSHRHPLILAVEDIHWADEGMLDLIEYLARWVRGPVLLICLARDELLERRPGWGGGRRNATTISLEPLSNDEARELVGALIPSGNGGGNGFGELVPEVAQRSGGNPLFAEEMVNRILEEGPADATALATTLPDTVHSVLAARLDALPAGERRIMQHAAVVGQTFWDGALEPAASEAGIQIAAALASLQEKDLIVATAGSRLAGEHEYSFKHVLIRDVAYSTLPKATRARKHYQVGRFVAEQAADRADGVVALVAEHFARAASIGEEAGLPEGELEEMHDRAVCALEAAGDAAAAIYSNQEALNHYKTALSLERGLEPETEARIGEKQGDVALRLGRVDAAVEVWERALDYHRRQEDLARVGDLHRKVGAGLWHRGEREASIAHYQKGIDLLKDGPPCLELVWLYEEAASLYLHTGDNMLAIYAAEKALRLAERLGEDAAASRAHLIFGRVFGRIGDSAKARQNLERSVELARESDPAEAVRALLALGYHLEVSEGEYGDAAAAYGEALSIATEVGDVPSQVELHAALAQLAVHRADWEEVARSTESSAALAEREGLVGKRCFPSLLRGILRWREANWDGAEKALRRAHELGEQAGRSEIAYSALFWLAATLRDRADYAGADTVLAQALDICERAGLVAQSMEAISARAVTLMLAGRDEQAREAASQVESLSARLSYPVGQAATKEALGAVAREPVDADARLAEAAKLWEELGRPLDAARAGLLRGRRLLDLDPDEAGRALEAAAERGDSLGVAHLARRARELVGA